MRTRSKTSAEKRNRDAQMEHFLHALEVRRMAVAAIRAGTKRGHGVEWNKLIAALTDLEEYIDARMPV